MCSRTAKRPAWRHRDWTLAVLLLTAGVLLAAWSLVTPAWESSDEADNWKYANYVRDHHTLPPFDKQYQEGNSPPLYYVLISPFTPDSFVPARQLVKDPDTSTHFTNLVTTCGCARLYPTSLHDLSDYPGLHLARLVTAIMSVTTVWWVFLAGVEATGRRSTGLLAGALVGFLPEFTFRANTVSNDALVTAMCALCTLLIVRLVRRGFSWPLASLIGLVGGICILSKVSGAVIVVGAAVAILSARPLAWRTRAVRLAPLLIACAVAAPWLLYNQLRFGDPLAFGAMLKAGQGATPHALFSTYFISDFPLALVQSFIGLFGWTNVYLPQPIYAIYIFVGGAVAAGLYGAIRIRRRQQRLLGVLLTIAVAGLLSVINFNLTFAQPQGRYLFPALPALGVLAAMALEGLPGWGRHPIVTTRAVAAGLAGINVAIMPMVIFPTYGLHL